MLIVLSPAKKMRSDVEGVPIERSLPQFHEKTWPIITKLSKFSKPKLMKLMSISPALTEMNLERYKSFDFDPSLSTGNPAIYAFNGEVYWGLESTTLKADELSFANGHLRMLSGLYGYLRPFDSIQPYRLEMGSKLPIGRKKNLYAYWADDVARAITNDLQSTESRTIINLASVEYAKVMDSTQIDAKIITVHFKEYRKGELRSIQFNLKRARGYMARYLIQNKITNENAAKGFTTDNYIFSEEFSNENEWLFVR